MDHSQSAVFFSIFMFYQSSVHAQLRCCGKFHCGCMQHLFTVKNLKWQKSARTSRMSRLYSVSVVGRYDNHSLLMCCTFTYVFVFSPSSSTSVSGTFLWNCAVCRKISARRNNWTRLVMSLCHWSTFPTFSFVIFCMPAKYCYHAWFKHS